MTNQIISEATYQMSDSEAIYIRPIRQSDLLALEWDGEYTHFRRLYAEHYANSRAGTTLIWIAETEAHLMVGQMFLLLYSKSPEIADGIHRAYLFSFRIKPAFRNQGLGTFMLQFAEDQLLLRGYNSIRLNVARTNPQARNLYERLGYRMIGPDAGVWRYQDHLGAWHTIHEPAWRMLKQLR
ncbi:MAG: GNAT family N-acetyltransferase [Anaerolineaceae bacterium]